MTKFCLFILACLIFFNAGAQFSDNFSDGDYTENPVWQAQPSDFIINNTFQLQSNNTNPNSTFQITTASTIAAKSEWEFWVKLDFNPSSANYVDVWLVSTDQNLSANTNAGYFVRIGSTDDNISLYKKEAGTGAQKIIDGQKNLLNTSSSKMRIRVIRTEQNRWILLRNMTGEGEVWKSEGETTDNAQTMPSYFGILIKQSTASFFQKHFFDDFVVRELEEMPQQLKILSVKATGNKSVTIQFNNPLNTLSAEEKSHYHLSATGAPASVIADETDGRVVHLIFNEELSPDLKYTLITTGVEDVFGNKITDEMSEFYFYKARRYDVVISEVFADPSPQIGLPSQKFVELKNRASFPVNLINWKLSDDNNTAVLPALELQPDSFIIITTTSGLDAYRLLGNTIAVSGFPALNLSGSRLSLCDNSNSLIHAMRYDLTSYGNEVKKDGGFSLEMINTNMACMGAENWTASNDPSGGTPGRKNSVDNNNPFPTTISLVNAYLSSPDTLILQFNKTIDSTLAVQKENYSLTENPGILSIESIAPFFDEVKITLAAKAAPGKIYTISVKNLSDCAESAVGNKNNARFGITVQPGTKDIVVNEILSEPKTSGAEYVELYNNSSHIFDISNLFLANRNSAGIPSSITRISSTPFLFFPGDFLLLTKDPSSTIRDYPFADASAIRKMSSMPSIPNDKGFVLLMDQQGNILDEVNYDKSWHFSLIKDKKGVSLERITYTGQSDHTNFHSAAQDVGYGTPGTKNSQSKEETGHQGEFHVSPEIFSPDNDGLDDFLTISYSFATAGYVTNIRIFDAAGRMVRHLQKNSLSGLKGYYRWDGLDDKNQALPQGIYMIYFESFDENGKKVVHKKNVVLARRR